jgi:hypothetical protein
MQIITDITMVTTIAQGFKNGYQSCLEDIGEKPKNRKTKSIDINHEIYGFRGGYKRCLRDKGILPHYISQREAYRRFGMAFVESWRKDGLIHPIKIGDSENSKILYKLGTLEILFDSSI